MKETNNVPSELASLEALTAKEIANRAMFGGLKFVKLSDVQSLFSHSAATGKTEDLPELPSPFGQIDIYGDEDCVVRVRSVDGFTADQMRAYAIDYAAKLGRAALASPAAPLAAAVPSALILDRYDTGLLGDGGGGNVEWWQDYMRAELDRAHDHYQMQVDGVAAVPAEEASALTDERIVEVMCDVTDAYSRIPFSLLVKADRAIEREVLTHLSKPTAQGTAQSIDTDEFRELMCNLGYWAEEDEGDRDHCAKSLIEFIDRHIAAQAPADRDAQHP